MICELLSVKKLPDDYYAVYKNITKYSKCELEDLLKIYGLENNENGINELNHKDRVLTSSEFNIFKKENPKIVEKNPNNYGIPQGSAISAVLSNIYMIKADCELNNYIKNKNGLYMRYCDDFIIVLPTNNEFAFRCQYRQIKLIIDNIPNVILSKEKTQIFNFNNRLLENCNNKFLSDVQKGKDIINYLGFSFDGKEVTIRDKTITKYYYRLYRKLNTIIKNNGYTKYGNKISCKNIYKKYSRKGAKCNFETKNKKNKGNFITYVQRAQRIFNDEPIDRKTRRHMLKIRRKLDKLK